MEKLHILWIFIIFVIAILLFSFLIAPRIKQVFQSCSVIELESFDNPLDIKEDKLDKLYTKLFDQVFDEKPMYIEECKIIMNFIEKHPVKLKKKDKALILDCGTGTGKHFQYLSAAGGDYKLIGLERSQSMIDIFSVRNPLGKVYKGDLRNENLFDGETFPYILCLKETLYHNQVKEWDSILNNFFYWLKPGGYLIIHVYDRTKLDPSPRNMTMIRYDTEKRKHGITNFPNFTHDGWWIQRGNVICQYNEIFALRDKKGDVAKKRHYKHNLAIPNKDKIMEKIIGNYFKLVEIVRLEKMGILDHELCFFKKNKF
jgi:SAM-dependent methyltransferase